MAKQPLPIPVPFTCPIAPARLPRKPADGQAVCDELGNIYEYSAFEGGWIYRGALPAPPEVSESQDGMVTPDVFDRLTYMKQVLDNGNLIPPTFKLNPNVDAYWYLWESADHLIRFRPESEQDLRIEFDRSRFYQLLMKMSCPGDKGPVGDPGDPGPTGTLLSEPCYGALATAAPPLTYTDISPDGMAWSFAIKVITPLTTDISVRLYDQPPPASDDSTANATILVPVSSTVGAGGTAIGTIGTSSAVTITVHDPHLKLDISKTSGAISYDPLSTLLSGTLYLTAGSWLTTSAAPPPTTRPPRRLQGNAPCICPGSAVPTTPPPGTAGVEPTGGPPRTSRWCLRARQRGPVGDPGPDANCMLTPASCLLPTPLQLKAVCPIVSVRQSCTNPNTLLTYCAPLDQVICASQLTFPTQPGNITHGGIVPTGNWQGGRLAAVLPQLQACKDLVKYTPEPDVPQTPSLALPDYQPLPGCQDTGHFNNVRLDWIPLTDKPADYVDWAEPYQPGTIGKKYPWLIMADDLPAATDTSQCDPCPPGATTPPPGLATTTTTPAPQPWALWQTPDKSSCYCQQANLPPMTPSDFALGTFVDQPACLSARDITCGLSQWYLVQLSSGGYQCFDAQSDLISQGAVVSGPYDQSLDCYQVQQQTGATTTPAPPGRAGGPCQ